MCNYDYFYLLSDFYLQQEVTLWLHHHFFLSAVVLLMYIFIEFALGCT
jgi:hypothetical protein